MSLIFISPAFFINSDIGQSGAVAHLTDLGHTPVYQPRQIEGLALELIARCDGVLVASHENKSNPIDNGLRARCREHKIPYFNLGSIPDIPWTEKHNPEQCRAFINEIMSMYRVHLEKNKDYSPANILGAGEIGATVRLWDKVARLMNLTGFRLKVEMSEYIKPREPQHESLDDTLLDLAVYGIIARISRSGKWGK